jgi:beta-mannosidase
MSGKICWKLCDADSNILQSGEEEVTVSPLSVKRLGKMDFSDINPQTAHLTFALVKDGETISEGSVLFTQAKYYDFKDPKLRSEIADGEILVYSDAYAKSVWIEGVDGDLLLEDNGFDMEKGCRKVRILSGNATQLIVKSVYDIR